MTVGSGALCGVGIKEMVAVLFSLCLQAALLGDMTDTSFAVGE